MTREGTQSNNKIIEMSMWERVSRGDGGTKRIGNYCRVGKKTPRGVQEETDR